MIDPSQKRNKTDERPWYKPALELIKMVKKGKALDLGCGLGEFSYKLKNNGIEVYCADGSKDYIKRLKKAGFDAKQADFNKKLPFKDKKFDLVTCLEVIEHVEKAEDLLGEIKRILKNKGFLLLSTPNYAFLGVRLNMLLGKSIPDEGYHFRFFTYKTLTDLLKKKGFNILGDNSISFLPFYRLTKNKPKGRKVTFMKNLLASKIIILAKKDDF